MSVVRSVRRVLPGMRKNNWGRILAVTSISVKMPVENLMLSNGVRAGVTGFLKTLSIEEAKNGVTVNCICPGYFLTDRVKNLSGAEAEKLGKNLDETLTEWGNRVPMGRMGNTDEFSGLAAFLVSERSSYITGQSFLVDGGRFPGVM